MYKITLSMPIYNVEKYIERALLSALNQTFDSIEFLLVDDKGSDSSINIAKEIIAKHPRGKDIRIIDHGENRGTGATKNTAIDNAQGEFIYFMDSDDEITPDCISTLYKAMIETPVDFVAASYKTVTQNGQLNNLYLPATYPDRLISPSVHAVAKAHYWKNNLPVTIYTWNKLYNVNFLRNNHIRCIPHHLAEDLFFTFQVILKAQSCRLLSETTYVYYETKGSIAGVYNHIVPPKAAKTFEEIIIAKIDYMRSFKKTLFYPFVVRRVYAEAIRYAMKIYGSRVIPMEDKKRYVVTMINITLQEIKLIDPFYRLPIWLISKTTNTNIKLRLANSFNTLFLIRALLKTLSICRKH
jgi:glycosyltransferase involved in cell wall biosynthesis